MLSPLLQSALEDYRHSMEHLESGGELDNKYAIIHISNAIELLLKEKVRSLGMSIFKNNNSKKR